ncbi:MAG TPA: HD domain-containing protein [Methanothermobacter sp.]|jgi:HD superfamily phosphohydrolase|uniref:Phosphodiesterase n=1 Tax=Methanothermobacter tenebrarum TaxID=680118 RepID=A0ABM7YD67_9EURY|nr:HD domain-containing protein [Methanothermobacter tenebrarum]MDD3455128.1 HD domain-containing protein [Methanobacteriales archaeon]MDI6881687.1 HD domain-containing protein [Methanothermobacter sp.]MDX9693101.1 HD domain-containing protein [Methanothermobacter sp.]BDH79340.1 phosphodiesterase [Methanothermobacter tenebrarum]HHW16137.1 HD domain-containing protein [Methanothermobacter sp.]
MKFIRDSIHGNLQINDFEVKLIDTPPFQRLRRIKQLGFTNLIYPGANHTRFEHSIGTMHLASQLADQLGLDKHKKSILRVSALLHDLGHGPFSHVSEAVIPDSHEELTIKVIRESIISDILMEKFDLEEIEATLKGEGVLGQAISGEIDVDRMDYLLRDSHYTGVAYGIIDVERLIQNIKIEDDLILDKKGVPAAESTLLARYFMYPSVYQHHTTRIVNSMFRRCLKILIGEDKIDPKRIYHYDDMDIITICRRETGLVSEMIKRLDTRKLLKRVATIRLNELEDPERIFKITESEIIKAESEIAEDMNIDPDYLIIDVPEYPAFDEMKTQVDSGDSIVKLSDISSLVRALRDARFNHADLCIYTLAEESEKFKKFNFYDYLDLPRKIKRHEKQLCLTTPKIKD